jgi:hypothetical protein
MKNSQSVAMLDGNNHLANIKLCTGFGEAVSRDTEIVPEVPACEVHQSSREH